MIKLQKRYFIETLEKNETNLGHKHNAHMYSSRFAKHLYDETAISRFEILTKPLYKCNGDRPYYATTYQDNFLQYPEVLNFITLLRKQNWFGAVHPNSKIDAKLDYMVSRVLLEMDHTSLSIYKKTL